MVTEESIRQGLKTRIFGRKIYTFDTIDSTNRCAKAIAGCGAEDGTIVIAEEQTAGRGRLGRKWESKPNENLMFSIVLHPRMSPEELNLLPLHVSVAVAQALENITALKIECKWPNDLLINKKKVAGILLEGSVKQSAVEYVVIGVGINVNQSIFDGDLKAKATSLKLEAKKEFDRLGIFREILRVLETNYKVAKKQGFQSTLPLWLARSTMLNKPISVSQEGTVFSGVVKGLSNDGGLVLRSNGTERTLFAGDVTVVGM